MSKLHTMLQALSKPKQGNVSINEVDALVMRWSNPLPGLDRYIFDFKICNGEGWEQYDTDQDAHYFGVWVNKETMETFTYCEGDLIYVRCATPDIYNAELKRMGEFYGAPPPAFIVYDLDAKTRTAVYDSTAAHGRNIPEE